jgi:hypothetical protein
VERIATLCRIERIDKQDIGARVEIVAEARLALTGVVATDPFVKGVFQEIPTCADPTLYEPSEQELDTQQKVVREIRASLDAIIQLSDRLNSPKVGQGQAEGEGGGGEAAAWQEWGHAELSDLKRSLEWVDGDLVRLQDLAGETTMEDFKLGQQVRLYNN